MGEVGNCPKCGASKKNLGPVGQQILDSVQTIEWECGSSMYTPAEHFSYGDRCVESRITRLKAALAEAERERDEAKKLHRELVLAIWWLDELDDSTHQETLNQIGVLWERSLRPVTRFLDQTQQLTAATARADELVAGIKLAANDYTQGYNRNSHSRLVLLEYFKDSVMELLAPAQEAGDGK